MYSNFRQVNLSVENVPISLNSPFAREFTLILLFRVRGERNRVRFRDCEPVIFE
jgi:hypothetical protein